MGCAWPPVRPQPPCVQDLVEAGCPRDEAVGGL